MKGLLAFTLALSGSAPAGAAMAWPAGFGCYKPIVELPENRQLSRYMYQLEDHVFDLKVYVNTPSSGDGISIGSKQFAACKIILPAGGYLRQAVEWRQAKSASMNDSVYKSIKIQQAGGGGAMTDWLLLKPRSPNVAGVATIEFHVYVNYPDPGE